MFKSDCDQSNRNGMLGTPGHAHYPSLLITSKGNIGRKKKKNGARRQGIVDVCYTLAHHLCVRISVCNSRLWHHVSRVRFCPRAHTVDCQTIRLLTFLLECLWRSFNLQTRHTWTLIHSHMQISVFSFKKTKWVEHERNHAGLLGNRLFPFSSLQIPTHTLFVNNVSLSTFFYPSLFCIQSCLFFLFFCC